MYFSDFPNDMVAAVIFAKGVRSYRPNATYVGARLALQLLLHTTRRDRFSGTQATLRTTSTKRRKLCIWAYQLNGLGLKETNQ
jgi:hypothetical protein